MRQPWADVQLAPAVPTEEQLEWLEKEGFIKDDEDEEGDKEGEEGGVPKKRKVRSVHARPSSDCDLNGVLAQCSYSSSLEIPLPKAFFARIGFHT